MYTLIDLCQYIYQDIREKKEKSHVEYIARRRMKENSTKKSKKSQTKKKDAKRVRQHSTICVFVYYTKKKGSLKYIPPSNATVVSNANGVYAKCSCIKHIPTKRYTHRHTHTHAHIRIYTHAHTHSKEEKIVTPAR